MSDTGHDQKAPAPQPQQQAEGPQTLPSSTLGKMQSGFGQDFSNVRVHENSKEVGGAQALARGNDVHFGAGQYNPGSSGGDWLIGHELSHVVQQRKGSAASQSFDPSTSRGLLEAEADRAATTVAGGGRANITMGTEAGATQKYEAWEHTALGNEGGGSSMMIEVGRPRKIKITYGEVVALSGDFYPSAEALYNAPSDELDKVLKAVRNERVQAESHFDPNDPANAEKMKDPDYKPPAGYSKVWDRNANGGKGDYVTVYDAPDDNQQNQNTVEYDDATFQSQVTGGRLAHHNHADGACSDPACDKAHDNKCACPKCPDGQKGPQMGQGQGQGQGQCGGQACNACGGAGCPPGGQQQQQCGGAACQNCGGAGCGPNMAPNPDANKNFDQKADGGAGDKDQKTGEAKGNQVNLNDGFVDLAIKNSSHFSPENIKLNWTPRHRDALVMAQEAFRLDKGKAVGEVKTPGADYKAKLEADEKKQDPKTVQVEQKDNDQKTKDAGHDAAQKVVKAGDGDAAKARERMNPQAQVQYDKAMIQSGFSSHFLTDAFASGHLISGVTARDAARGWWATNEGNMKSALRTCALQEHGLGGKADAMKKVEVGIAVAVAVKGVEGMASMLLKAVHDVFNASGLQVKNRVGAQWMTYGDGNMGRSAETKAQGSAATIETRKTVADVAKTGEWKESDEEGGAYSPIRFVPNQVKAISGSWKPLEGFAQDPAMFKEEYTNIACNTDPRANRIYNLIKGNFDGQIAQLKKQSLQEVKDAPGVAKKKLGEGWDWLKGKAGGAWDATKKKAGDAWDGTKKKAGDAWDATKEKAGEAWDGTKKKAGEVWDGTKQKAGEAWDGTKEKAGQAWDGTKEKAGQAWNWIGNKGTQAKQAVGETWDAGKKKGGELVDAGKQKGAELVDDGKKAATGAWGWIKGKYQDGKQAVSNGIDAGKQKASDLGDWANGKYQAGKQSVSNGIDTVKEKAGDLKDGVVQGAKDLKDGAKKKAAGWVADLFKSKAVEQPKAETPKLEAGTESKVDTGSAAVDPLNNQTYAHGAFMGAAGDLMKDMQWNGIFRTLMPGEHAKASAIKEAKELIGFMENNPVMAAFGSAKALVGSGGQKEHEANPVKGKPTPLEWDVWLDPVEPGNVSKARIAHGNKGTTLAQHAMKNTPVGMVRDDVKNAPSGTDWMNIFGRAIALYRGGGQEKSAQSADDSQKKLEEVSKVDNAQQAMDICAQFLKEPGGLILDVKSTYSTPQQINEFVNTLEKIHHVHVWGVGSFDKAQLKGLNQGVRPVLFYHSVDGLLHAAHESKNNGPNDPMQKGDRIMFNAGSLLQEKKAHFWSKAKGWELNQTAVQKLVAVQKQFDLGIGLYVQETDVDETAVDLITKMTNKMPGVFRDGFAYGNVKGKAETKTEGSGMGAQSTPALGEKASTVKDTISDHL